MLSIKITYHQINCKRIFKSKKALIQKVKGNNFKRLHISYNFVNYLMWCFHYLDLIKMDKKLKNEDSKQNNIILENGLRKYKKIDR